VSVDGLWTAEFRVEGEVGTGVVVFANGQIMGGDAHYYYSGSYLEEGYRIEASVIIKHYSGGLTNVFGRLRELPLKLVGTASGGYIIANGYDQTSPSLRQVSVKLQLVKRFRGAQ
jgi:hypothetical protein